MNIAYISVFVVLALAVSAFAAACVIIGKRGLRLATRPVEYYPPRGYSPIDVMQKYYGKRAKSGELFNPLMLYWARRGFIKIEEDCKRGLKLTKLKPLQPQKWSGKNPATVKNFKFESELFNTIFESDDMFYTLAAKKAVRKSFDETAQKANEQAQTVVAPITKKLHVLSCVAAMAVLAAAAIATGVITREISNLAMIFVFVGIIASRFFIFGIPDTKFRPLMVLFFTVWAGAPFTLLMYSLPTDGRIVIGFTVASAALVMLFLSRMIEIRSSEDREIYGRLRAFKTFLVQAELDKLETLVEDDPDYFFDILPYCYVLHLTRKLKPKFDRITLEGPSAYLGSLRDTLMF